MRELLGEECPSSYSDADMARYDREYQSESMRSVRALHTAWVHLLLRERENPAQEEPAAKPDEPVPHPDAMSDEAFRFHLARRIAGQLGQPERCPERACRRAGVCCGLPPDCWREEPPPTHREIDLAKTLMRYRLDHSPRVAAAKAEDEARAQVRRPGR